MPWNLGASVSRPLGPAWDRRRVLAHACVVLAMISVSPCAALTGAIPGTSSHLSRVHKDVASTESSTHIHTLSLCQRRLDQHETGENGMLAFVGHFLT